MPVTMRLFGPAFAAASRALSAAASLRPRYSAMPRASRFHSPLLLTFTAVRPRASAASSSALFVDGRILHALAARSAVTASLVPLANERARCRVAASSLFCPNHAWRAATFRERFVSFGLAADDF